MISVGVSGHRRLKNVNQVATAVAEALQMIVQTYGSKSLVIISPLAEGADRLVVWQALANYPVQLVVPLPFEISEYMQDFKSGSSQAEFINLLEQADQVIEAPAAQSREAGYLAAGMYVINHCDVLLAVWDGQEARGMGGTGEIVSKARNLGIPLAWIKVTDKPGKPTLIFERIPGLNPGGVQPG